MKSAKIYKVLEGAYSLLVKVKVINKRDTCFQIIYTGSPNH